MKILRKYKVLQPDPYTFFDPSKSRQDFVQSLVLKAIDLLPYFFLVCINLDLV